MKINSRSAIQTEATVLARSLTEAASVDEELAELTVAGFGDAQLAAVWLALPLEELGGRSPLELWKSGERQRVIDLVYANRSAVVSNSPRHPPPSLL